MAAARAAAFTGGSGTAVRIGRAAYSFEDIGEAARRLAPSLAGASSSSGSSGSLAASASEGDTVAGASRSRRPAAAGTISSSAGPHGCGASVQPEVKSFAMGHPQSRWFQGIRFMSVPALCSLAVQWRGVRWPSLPIAPPPAWIRQMSSAAASQVDRRPCWYLWAAICGICGSTLGHVEGRRRSCPPGDVTSTSRTAIHITGRGQFSTLVLCSHD